MSKFTTHLPTDVDELISILPKQSYIHGITLNPETNKVFVIWENTQFESGLTVPIDFELSDLKKKLLPSNVKDITKHKPTPKIVPKVEVVVPKVETVISPKWMTEDEVNKAFESGKTVEFMGVTPTWREFTKNDVFTNGFFYRLKNDIV